MAEQEIEIEDLKKAGLTGYQAKSYICLLKYGAQEGREVAKKTDVPKTRVYDVLRGLVEKGLASKIQDNPMKFSPTDPKSGLKSLYEEKRNKLKFHEEKALEDLEEIEKRKKKSPKVKEKVDVISGYKKMFSFLSKRFSETRDELLILSVGEEIPHKLKVTIKRLNERGVDLKFIASKYDEENIDILKEFQDKLGLSIRHFDTTQEYTLSVRDKEEIMVNVRDPENREDRVSIFFEIPGLAQALQNYFYSLWEKGEEVNL